MNSITRRVLSHSWQENQILRARRMRSAATLFCGYPVLLTVETSLSFISGTEHSLVQWYMIATAFVGLFLCVDYAGIFGQPTPRGFGQEVEESFNQGYKQLQNGSLWLMGCFPMSSFNLGNSTSLIVFIPAVVSFWYFYRSLSILTELEETVEFSVELLHESVVN